MFDGPFWMRKLLIHNLQFNRVEVDFKVMFVV